VSSGRRVGDRLGLPLLLGLGIGVGLTIAARAESTVQRDAPTNATPLMVRAAGTATTYGTTTKFYAPDGRLVGSATHNSGRR
jgi:hypothetical protein